MKREQKIQREIIDYLNKIGSYSFKVVVGNRSGIPDIICCLKGDFVAFEVKRGDGVATPLQKLEIEKIKLAGGKSIIVKSVDEVKEFIKHFGGRV